jgi:hypothetical protein
LENVTDVTLGIMVGKNIGILLHIVGANSGKMMEEFFSYHCGEFKKNEVVGLILASEWLEKRGVEYTLSPPPECSWCGRLISILWLKLAKKAYGSKRK